MVLKVLVILIKIEIKSHIPNVTFSSQFVFIDILRFFNVFLLILFWIKC